MVHFNPTTGTFSFEDAAVTAYLLENEQRARLAAEAEQTALSVVYRVTGKPDPTRPCVAPHQHAPADLRADTQQMNLELVAHRQAVRSGSSGWLGHGLHR